MHTYHKLVDRASQRNRTHRFTAKEWCDFALCPSILLYIERRHVRFQHNQVILRYNA
jgi:hypothetical protein